MNGPASMPAADAVNRRVRPLVALRLLEVIRDQDHPMEVMESEDPAVTMPRRLGLSDVVERQIRTYREDVKHGSKLTDAEVSDLFRLVIRRPDSEEVFLRVGQVLAGPRRPPGWRRALPKAVGYAIARSKVRRRLKKLFGRRVGGFGRGAFMVEGRSLIFIEADPGGDACWFMNGFCKELLEHAAGRPARVDHVRCQARGDEVCRWEGTLLEGAEDHTAKS